MKTRLLFVALLTAGFIFTSCGNSINDKPVDSSSNTSSKPEGPDCWQKAEFQNTDLGEDSMGIPRTIVKVMVCEELVTIDTVVGSMTEYTKDQSKDMEVPADAVAVCGGWYAGGGDYFYIQADKDGVEIYHGYQDEEQTDSGYHWEKAKEIR